MANLEVLLDRIRSIEIATRLAFVTETVEEALARRDNERFATRWMAAYQQIELRRTGQPFSIPVSDDIHAIRMAFYLTAFERWQSADLAGCISDDMGLICEGLATQVNNTWVNSLLRSYLNGEFPTDPDACEVLPLAAQVLALSLPFDSPE